MHTTFRDFLLNFDKMKLLPRHEFHVQPSQAHATLSLGCMRMGMYFINKYFPVLLTDDPIALALRRRTDEATMEIMVIEVVGRERIRIVEPDQSVYALRYAQLHCIYHRELSLQSAEMTQVAETFDRIGSFVLFRAFARAIIKLWQYY
ncbi:hypothetical protein C8Q76DRAFT_753884 [Earliella scabrosa]|nr:hypothetical protein C8Q76DRAFT_753884 [Earliella scabrosa]